MSSMMILAKELRLLAHKYGYENFRDAVTQSCYNAATSLEDLGKLQLAQRYRYLAEAVNNAACEEPEFDQDDFFKEGV